jgi:hypothetical protein
MIQKVLYIARQSADKDNAITSFKIIIAFIENLYGKIDHILPFIVDTCVNEMNSLHPKQSKKVQSVILQTLCLCFWYNTSLVFQICEPNTLVNYHQEQQPWIFFIFQRLLQLIPSMYYDFEMRRVLLGLTSIVGLSPSNNLPELIF